ncbi:MAG: SDR family oxidoreductase [Bellilinea sp.]
MDLKLAGKIALVIGSSRGLGYAAAQALAEEGAKVAINSRNSDQLGAAALKLHQSTGGEILPVTGDVTDKEAAHRIIDETTAHFGGLDILITNAGGPPAGSFENFDDETWQHAIELSLMSHVRLIRAALPHLRKSAHPAVLTITSYSVKQPIPNLVLSNSIRAATAGLTKTLSIELGPQGIRFNSILPGWTETERVIVLMDYRAQAGGSSIKEEITQQSRDIPLGRFARPEEFGRVAAFLVSPAASYINGVMLPVDGGAIKGV